jgi:hypothetical protein
LQILDGREDDVESEVDQIDARDRDRGFASEDHALIDEPIGELEQTDLVVARGAEGHVAANR